MNGTSVFEYNKNRLIATVTLDSCPQAIAVVKDYLTSRLIPDEERTENPIQYIDRLLRSLPDKEAAKIDIDREATILRGFGIRATTKAIPLIAAIPNQPEYSGTIDITKGYRSSNVAIVDLTKSRKFKDRATLEVSFDNSTGDDTKPIFWMQYDGLLTNAAQAGFTVQRGTLDEQIAAFKEDKESYFRGNVRQAMSSFEYPELKLVLQFLWGNNLPEDIQRQLVQ